MVVRGWVGGVTTALAAAAAAGAAQLGLGYGMDIISWPSVAGEGAAEGWRASLVWAAWITASATIVGAIVADRLRFETLGAEPARHAVPPGEPIEQLTSLPEPSRSAVLLGRLGLVCAAAVGSAITAVLVAVPARVAEVADVSSPQVAAGSYALLGALLGLIMAMGALTARAIAANLLATAGWLWLLAAVAVTDGVVAGRAWTQVPLGFWEWGASGPWSGSVLLPDAGVAVLAALALGALAALPAVRRGDRPAHIVISGAAGPLVVAIAYLLTQPDLTGAGGLELSRHLVVPYLVVAGLLGSLLASAVPARSPRPAPDPEPVAEPTDADVAAPAPRSGVEEPVAERA